MHATMGVLYLFFGLHVCVLRGSSTLERALNITSVLRYDSGFTYVRRLYGIVHRAKLSFVSKKKNGCEGQCIKLPKQVNVRKKRKKKKKDACHLYDRSSTFLGGELYIYT